MTLAEMRAEVFRRLRENSADPRYWRDTDIDEALNEGYNEVADATEYNEKYQTIDLLEDQQYYDARTVLRSGFLVLGPAYNSTTSRWLEPIATQDLDRADFRWEQRSAEPDRFFVRGLWWISYWPWKGEASGTIKQYYRALPTPLAEDTDEPGFHSSYHYGLVEYALFDLFAQDAEVDLAVAAWQAYLGYEEQIRSHMDARNSVPLEHGYGR